MPISAENKCRYPADWTGISIRIRFERAGGQCECDGRCGRGTHDGRCPNRHLEPAYGTGSKVILTTAHLNHLPEDCSDENLMAMCQGCHLHYDRDHHKETKAAAKRKAMAGATIAKYPEGIPIELVTEDVLLLLLGQECDHVHRGPQGPNEDMAWCTKRMLPTFTLRPEGETYGGHLRDCSLPLRHESYCVGGGQGHPVAELVRGFWPEEPPIMSHIPKPVEG